MGSSAVQPRLAAPGSALTHRRARRRYGPPRVPRPSPSSLWRMRGLVEAVGTAGSRSRRGEAPRLRRRRRALSSPLPPHFQAVATTTASAAGGAAAYCLSPRRRCGAAPARPAGEPRAPHGGVAGGERGALPLRAVLRRGPERGSGAAGAGRGRAGGDEWAARERPPALRLPPPSAAPFTHCLPRGRGAPCRSRSPTSGPPPLPEWGARPPCPFRCLDPRPSRSAPMGAGAVVAAAAAPRVPPVRESANKCCGREGAALGGRRERGALSAPVPGGAAGAPARVGDVQPEGTHFGTVPWAQLC
ncbi:hypothetical protein EI555_001422 [Monodon monoceros]|uniref:Uncharacterized protein n=1 Tax=Monodon monoceros TaxID=40151 RepID=A0A4U1EDV2_MONMO|nr:hypothetical protein EI555_001422 [Monodon monoceros]